MQAAVVVILHTEQDGNGIHEEAAHFIPFDLHYNQTKVWKNLKLKHPDSLRKKKDASVKFHQIE